MRTEMSFLGIRIFRTTSQRPPPRLLTRTDFKYDYSTGKPIEIDFQPDVPAERFIHRYTYDEQANLKVVETSRNGVMWDRDAVYDYNKDGSLRRETIGEDSIQGKDYTYTLLGNIKAINHASLNPATDAGQDGVDDVNNKNKNVARDAFGMIFNYHTDDFKRSFGTTESALNDTKAGHLGVRNNLYSGLLGAVSYKTQAMTTAELNSSTLLRNGELSGERYYYDKLARLRGDTTYKHNGTNWVSDGNDAGWSSLYHYDQNSNITRVQREIMTSATAGEQLDDAVLAMKAQNSNVINTINESASEKQYYPQNIETATATQSMEDVKGRVLALESNVKANANTYNAFDKAELVTRGNTTALFLYDAFGSNTRIKNENGATVSYNYLVSGSLSSDRAVYKGTGSSAPGLSEWSILGMGRLGVNRNTGVVQSGDTYLRNVGQIVYESTDHLGSVRALHTDVKVPSALGGATFQPQILASINYEVFGGHRPYTAKESETRYRYGFQGMRFIDGITDNSDYTTPARLYDVRMGRWTAQDPLADVSSGWSPYKSNYCNPTIFTDPTGELEYYTQDGSNIGNNGDNDGRHMLLLDQEDINLVERNQTTQQSELRGRTVLFPPYAVRQHFQVVCERMKQPTADDLVGGFHEEAFATGFDNSAQFHILDIVPSGVGTPRAPRTVNLNNFQNPSILPRIIGVLIYVHVHPIGLEWTNAQVFNWNPLPSFDINLTRDGILDGGDIANVGYLGET